MRSGGPAGPLARLFDGLFPVHCVLCGGPSPEGDGAPLCPVCLHRLPRPARPRCRRCGATHVLGVSPSDRCPECEDWPEELERVGFPFLMREGTPTRRRGRGGGAATGAERLVHGLKFSGWTSLAVPMGRAMLPEAGRLAAGRAVALVPVPISPARRRERGFNQAALLARALGEAAGWPIVEALARRPGGRRQARLGRRDRRENVEARFHRREDARSGPGGPLLLVDDVLTTGATLGACARALGEGGAEVLGGVVFARALQPIEAR